MALIYVRRDTTANWLKAGNPVLQPGEGGLNIDTGEIFFGDGTTPYTDLPKTQIAPGGKSFATVDDTSLLFADDVLAALATQFVQPPKASRHPLTGWFHLDGFGAKGQGASVNDLPALQAAYAACGVGDTIYAGSKTYGLGGQFHITAAKPITLRGNGWSQTLDSFSTVGTRFVPTTALDQGSLESLIKISGSYAVLRDFAVEGKGATAGASGVLVTGIPGKHAHGNTLDRLAIFGFEHGLLHGAYSDHTTMIGGRSAGNNHGVGLAKDNHFDFFHSGVLLDGNVTSSVHLIGDAASVNSTFVRCHLGFSKYGILQDDTASGNGFTGLTLIDSPIESVSEQMMKIAYGGNIRVEGGYWLWNGTPAKAAFSIGVVNQGPVWISPRLEEQTKNPNSPAVVQVTGFTNFAVEIDTPLNGFAQKKIGGVYNTLPPGTSPVTPNGRIGFYTLEVLGPLTIAPPLYPEEGAVLRIRLRGVNLAEPAVVTLSSAAGGFKFGSDVPGPLSVANGSYRYVTAIYNPASSKWDVLSLAGGF
jgi:hypothetical protein